MIDPDATSRLRAELTQGISDLNNYAVIGDVLRPRLPHNEGCLLDVGCGQGNLWNTLKPLFQSWLGVDLVRHSELPADRQVISHNLDREPYPLPDACADVVIACEVVPCLENPRALIRQMARLVKPGGWVVVTNPNCRSLTSLMTLLLFEEYRLFRDNAYPFMITPVLKVDLRRMIQEAGLIEGSFFYSGQARLPFSGKHFPKFLGRWFPRLFSDNMGIIAGKPAFEKK